LGRDLADYLLRWLKANDPDQLPPDKRILMISHEDYSLPSDDLWRNAEERAALESFLRDAARRCQTNAAGFEHAMADALRQQEASYRELFEEKRDTLRGWRTFDRQIHRLLAFSMLMGNGCHFDERRDRFDELLGIHDPRDGLAIVTLNYDLLIEEALDRRGVAYWYPGVRDETNASSDVPIFKLHGSINWQPVPGGAVSSTLEVAQRNARPMTLSGPDNTRETGMDCIIRGGRPNIILHYKHDETSTPLLEVYARGKPALDNWEGIQAHFEQCLDKVRVNSTADVTVIGVGVPENVTEDDPRLHDVVEVLSEQRGRRAYVDPAQNKAWEAAGFHKAADTFGQYIRRQRS